MKKHSRVIHNYNYYPDGNLKQAVGGGVSYCYDYTPEGRLQTKSTVGKKLLEYSYDKNGNVLKLLDAKGKNTYYQYDLENRLERLFDEKNKQLANYCYDQAGRVQAISYGNQVRTEYTYTETDQVESLVTVTKDGQVLLNYQYAYDGDGNCIQKSGNTHQNSYAYDLENRLTSAAYDGKQERFTYDLVGNRTSRETEETKEYYRYNSKNQLTRLECENGFTQYQYDRQGNLEREVGPQGIKDYSYDALNHQTRVKREDGYRLINRYDGENLRYQTEEDGKIIHFVFDKEQNLSVEEGENSIRIIRGHEAVAREEGEWEEEQEEKGRYQYYTQDEQKSTMYLLDENQEIQNAYRYDAFGNMLEKEEESINRLLYTGQIYDEGTGQYYLRARFYSPAIGRFLQEDVYRGDGLNLYAYCGNNPVMYYDPSGYMSFCNILPSDGNIQAVNADDVNFMQSSIKNQTGEYTVLGNAEALKNGTLKVEDLPNIKIWQDNNGKLWTLDHRRLASFRLAGLKEVPFQWATLKEVDSQMWKMTTTTGGKVIKLKLGNGKFIIIGG